MWPWEDLVFKAVTEEVRLGKGDRIDSIPLKWSWIQESLKENTFLRFRLLSLGLLSADLSGLNLIALYFLSLFPLSQLFLCKAVTNGSKGRRATAVKNSGSLPQILHSTSSLYPGTPTPPHPMLPSVGCPSSPRNGKSPRKMRICPALCSHPRRSSEKEGSWDVLTTTSHRAVHHPRGERKLTSRNSATTHLLSTGSRSALWRVWNDFLHTVPYWNIPRRQQSLTLAGRQTQRNNKGQKRYGISHGHQHTHKFTGKYFSVNTNLRHSMHRNKTSTFCLDSRRLGYTNTIPIHLCMACRGQRSMQPENSRLTVHGDAGSS